MLALGVAMTQPPITSRHRKRPLKRTGAAEVRRTKADNPNAAADLKKGGAEGSQRIRPSRLR